MVLDPHSTTYDSLEWNPWAHRKVSYAHLLVRTLCLDLLAFIDQSTYLCLFVHSGKFKRRYRLKKWRTCYAKSIHPRIFRGEHAPSPCLWEDSRKSVSLTISSCKRNVVHVYAHFWRNKREKLKGIFRKPMDGARRIASRGSPHVLEVSTLRL